eukprot:scaffold89578_cov55-Attheya_sp.AAC.2
MDYDSKRPTPFIKQCLKVAKLQHLKNLPNPPRLRLINTNRPLQDVDAGNTDQHQPKTYKPLLT